VKGHQQIVALRSRGMKPRCVFIHVGGEGVPRHVERDIEGGALPEVWTGDTYPPLADLRFVRGLRVHLDAWRCSRTQFYRWWDAVIEAGASEIYGVNAEGSVMTWRR
jgi:hypothetical protein